MSGALTMVAVPAATPAGANPTPFTGAGFISDPGDWLGQGHTYAFPTVTYNGLRGGYPTFTVSSSTDSFQVWFAAPAGQPLVATSYEGAQRFDFRAPGTPGLDIFGDGRGCNTVAGSFTVAQATYDTNGDVQSFSANFTDHCEGGTPALHGYLAYNATAVPPPQLVAAPASVGFGNTRVSDFSSTQAVQIENIGGPVTVSNLTLAGADPHDFGGQTSCDTTLELGQTCTIDSFFAPGAPGARSATIEMHAGSTTVGSIGLSGSGTIGYYLGDSAGDVLPYGDARWFGDMGSSDLNAPIVALATTPDGDGYWQLGQDGGVFSHGDAAFFGSTGGMTLNRPVVSMAPTLDGGGYWFVASDGGIFSFGDAAFYGSTGNLALNQPIVGMAPTADGRGYWLVAADGGIFSFGDAAFHGSTGNLHLNSPIVGMAPTPDGRGYWLVAADGGIFSFGDATFFGSTGSPHLNSPIVGMAPTWDGGGYWMVADDGGVFSFGDAPFLGSAVTPGSAGGIGMATTFTATIQAANDLPAVRRARMRHVAAATVQPGWQPLAH